MLQVTMSLVCGGVAGLVSSTATFPLYLVRRRMQLEGQGGARRYAGYTDVVASVLRRDGLRGFYAGILPEYYKARAARGRKCLRAAPACSAAARCCSAKLSADVAERTPMRTSLLPGAVRCTHE